MDYMNHISSVDTY